MGYNNNNNNQSKCKIAYLNKQLIKMLEFFTITIFFILSMNFKKELTKQ